jgi:hypothetical protein
MLTTTETPGSTAIDICVQCRHWTKTLKAKREQGGRIVRTCDCPCHPPTELITSEMLRTSGWHEPEPQSSPATSGWDS